MGRPAKVVALRLEEEAIRARSEGLSLAAVAGRLNAELTRRGCEDSVTVSAIKRYFTTLDDASLPELHRPQAAAANARVALDVGEQFISLNRRVQGWLDA